MDVYHKSLCYCLGISDDTRRNINRIYDFKTGCVKPECLHDGWQTSGSEKVVRMAFNLYCNGSQFEKIPLSQERQVAIIERQIDEIELAIAQAKADNGERYTIKQMEKSRKSLLTRLEKLNDASRKDNVVTFEQLGVDRLFVDESYNYKNLFLYTKMRNVAGIAQSEAQKSSDMFAKCQYLDELTGGKGVTFATGTPISNSMTELYTNMRYLQYGTLQKLGLGHFDSWASSFGETQTAIELAPEETGYRAKTRFAKFFNLPELIALFKESADIQTPDMLNLPVPEAEYENVVLKPSEYQKDMVGSLAERAEAVRDRQVQPYEDNMLKITNDGRKLALDQRLINDMLPDDENSKANMTESVSEISEMIVQGNTEPITDWLNEVISEGALPDEMQRAKVLLEKLAEYKPLAKIEEMEEQNYNMIDNVLNNGAEKAQREANKKDQEQPAVKVSLKARLAEKRAQVAGSGQEHEVQENTKKNQREI